MKLIYIAGAFRGPTPWDVEQNIRKAEAFALEVARMGAMPVCPHTMFRFFNGQLDDRFWLDGTLALLERCDAIALVPGSWERSTGTRGEIERAIDLDMPIFSPDEAADRELERQHRLRRMFRDRLAGLDAIRHFVVCSACSRRACCAAL